MTPQDVPSGEGVTSFVTHIHGDATPETVQGPGAGETRPYLVTADSFTWHTAEADIVSVVARTLRLRPVAAPRRILVDRTRWADFMRAATVEIPGVPGDDGALFGVPVYVADIDAWEVEPGDVVVR